MTLSTVRDSHGKKVLGSSSRTGEQYASGACGTTNEVTVAFTMSAFTFEGGRSLKLMGSLGQIRADMERNEIEVTSFVTREKEIIRLEAPPEWHGGGDEGIMQDIVRLVRQNGQEAGLTSASISVESHLMAFAAETSRMENRDEGWIV